MPGTYTRLLVHVVFSTKNRAPAIAPDTADRLYAYIGGVIRSEGGTLLCAGGVEDHVHLLIQCRADGAFSDLMRALKAKSSRWIHETFPDRADFAWQEGYAAFSVSRSGEAKVRTYLAGQREHHRTMSFLEELEELLTLHGVEFERKYLA
ncbi:MAG: IS200/IS605 family transposase [Phycisphaerales bacterium]|nr:IS200/IS605 family transposase [Phycisphaerales bacterium]